MPEEDNLSEGSSISRASEVDADWEDLAGAYRPSSIMDSVSSGFNQFMEHATSRIELIRESDLYRTYVRDSPMVSACAAIALGVLSLPALTFLSFIIILCLLTFMGFLFIEGTLITFGVIVTAGILFFIGTFVVSFGCCLYAVYVVLRSLKIVGSVATAAADGTKKTE